MSCTSRSIRSVARSAEERQLVGRKLVRREDPVADRVVDVVVDVGDAIDEPHDRTLERRRLLHPGMREDPVTHLVGEIEALRDAERLLVVPEPPAEPCAHDVVECLLARVPEWRVPRIVAEPDRLDQILVQTQCSGDDP